jgi:DNA-binding GntR family transcriptional regulator
MNKIIGRESLTDQIVTALRRRIINGELAEGMQLRQEWLASEMGVSRIPLREAIRQLEAEGFVTSELHKGTVVRALSLEEIQELFDIRIRLETWLFELAIPNLTEADFALAEELTDEAMQAGSVENWGDLNWRFHEVLYKPSGRGIALKLVKTVHDNANRYVNLHIAVAQDVERELSDHRTLIAYARLGDGRRGVDMLRGHIQRVSRNLIASLVESRKGEAQGIA